MTIHAITIWYEPNSYLTNTFLPQWLMNWSAWSADGSGFDDPYTKEFENVYTGDTVTAEGWEENRFEWEDTTRSAQEDRDYILSQLTGATGYLASYTGWHIIYWHECSHDTVGACTDWQLIESTVNTPDLVKL